MPTFLLYSLKAAGCLAVFYLFYKLLLSRDTLHRMNRVLLCGVLLLSFLLPLCVITVEKELPGVSTAGIDVIPESYFRRDMVFENRIPDDTRDLMIIEEPEPAPEPFDWGFLLGIIYFAGMFATLGWTVCNIVRVVRMTRRGRRIPLGNGSVLVLSNRIRAPFSWMKYVVMSEEDYACGGGTILVHEQAHQRLGHSWDLLLVDLLGCLQWFNPAMWLLRVELRAVHEYEADEQVLRCGVDAKDYQMLLIKKAVGGRWYSIANSLNHSNLKNRITMMLRKRSSRWARAKALYVLPLACLALGTFAQTSYVLPEDKTTKNSGNGEMLLVGGVFFFVCIISCFFHITCLYRIFDTDFMVIPFTFFSQKCHIKFLTNGRYRDIKPVNFLCITVAVFYCICGRFNDLGAILLCIFCSSCKQIYDLLGNQAYMDGHLAIFDRKLSFFVIGLIYMEHTAVCVKLCCINTIFQGICLGCVCLFLIGSFCILFGIVLGRFGFCGICCSHCRHRAKGHG